MRFPRIFDIIVIIIINFATQNGLQVEYKR